MQEENTNPQRGWLSSAYKVYQNVGNGPEQDEGAEGSPGRKSGKREKLANVLRAASEIRQNYYASRNSTATKGPRWNEGNHHESFSGEELMEYVSSGKEEIVLFPTWGRKCLEGLDKLKGVSEDSERNPAHESKAVVDINVQGWIYTAHTAFPPMRKNRFATAMIAKLCGLPPLSTATSTSGKNNDECASEDPFPVSGSAEENQKRHDTHELPGGAAGSKLAWITSRYGPQPIQQFASPVNPTNNEEAHKSLRTRLAPFLATPSFNMPLTVFFYNTSTAQSTTARTDSLGHFTMRKRLGFMPSHVRVLAGENLCAEDEVQFVDVMGGISLISDIDDTIKISGVGTGLREMFRNVFIREIPTMPVPGVAEWFRELANPPYNIQIHYVSNSPWQLFPFLKQLLVGHMKLPLGTWHLKKYNGLVQGIFEPVIERKKESLEMLLGSFPGRQWILVGDGGEGDLEVYTDVVQRWPGKIIAVYIRDVSGIGEEVLGAESGAYLDLQNEKNFFDGNTTGNGMKSLNFGEKPTNYTHKGLPQTPDQSLNRAVTDFTASPELGPEINLTSRRSTNTTTAASGNPNLLPNANKPVPPPIPSKPKELRGTQRLDPESRTHDQETAAMQAAKAGKTEVYQSLPATPDPIVALYDGRDYGPLSRTPTPPPLPRRKRSAHSSALPYQGESPDEYSLHRSPARNPAFPLGTSQTSFAPQLPAQRPLDKKAELWKKRWEHARQILAEQGVVLKSWKIGQEVHKESIELVKNFVNKQFQ